MTSGQAADAVNAMDPGTLTEDDIYCTSTQFRKWSFSSEALATARQSTNAAAAARVRALLLDAEVDTLTVDEELLLVRFFSNKVLQLSDHLKIPAQVAATAVQFVRRFYILNSCMDYHPQQICTSALFLATKTDNHYMPLRDFAKKTAMTPESIVAPEFRLMQGLQFAFDVRHPRRGLEAGMMILDDIAKERHQPHAEHAGVNAAKLRQELETLVGSGESKTDRLKRMHGNVRKFLHGGAILTDAYFLYTPAQIWLAAMVASDPDIARFFLGCILAGVNPAQRDAIIASVNDCARMISTDATVDKEERKRVSKKLEQCSNPETADLVKLNAAQKREATDANGNATKKQKVGNAPRDDPFGPSINP